MPITPVTPQRLVDTIVALVADRPGRVRLAVDGPPPTAPDRLGREVVDALRRRGRDALAVDAADFLRPASLRLEFGHRDPDEFLDGWLDTGALRREVLDPAGPEGSGLVLPRLWDAAADRAFRDSRVALAGNAVLVLSGALMLGRELPLDVAVHLRMGPTALARRTPEEQAWTLPAYERYEREHKPTDDADLLVLADHPDRPAVQPGTAGGRGGS